MTLTIKKYQEFFFIKRNLGFLLINYRSLRIKYFFQLSLKLQVFRKLDNGVKHFILYLDKIIVPKKEKKDYLKQRVSIRQSSRFFVIYSNDC